MPKMPVSPKPSNTFVLPNMYPAGNNQPVKVDKRQLRLSLEQGVSLQRAGRFLEAERQYQFVIQQSPDMPEACNLMGTLALEAKEWELAADYFEKAVRGLPKDPLIRHNIASALFQMSEFYDAVVHLRKATELKPNQIESLALLASCYSSLGRAGDAVEVADRALRFDPKHGASRVAKADALLGLGHMDAAETLLKENIAMRIAVPKSWQVLSGLRKFTRDSVELIAVREELKNSDLSEVQKKPMHFALAKISNDAKLYDEAFSQYAAAKSIDAARYDVSAYERRVDEQIQLFNSLFLGVRQDFGDTSVRPIFIVGMPRSGTTLTEQIISSHPLVEGGGELGEIGSIARSLGDNPRSLTRYGTRLSALSKTESGLIAQRYLKFIDRISRESPRVTDKMPHNFEHIGLIALLFPNANIIHCKRDAIDNCLSCYMNAFDESHSYSADLKKLGRYYRAYDRLMRHWQTVLPGRIFENQYETLIENQESQSRKLIAHCQLEWDDACLDYTANERTVTTISRWQVRQPIYKTSVKRWKAYEQYLPDLISGLGELADLT